LLVGGLFCLFAWFSYRSIRDTLCGRTDFSSGGARGGRPYREREVMVPWNKGRLLPGWSVKIRLEDGIRKIELSENIKV